VFDSLPIAVDLQENYPSYGFTCHGWLIKSLPAGAYQAGLSDVVLRHLGHLVATHVRRGSADAHMAMEITAQRTMAVFKRYNTIDGGDLATAQRQMDP
jgi:hypothetical protein